MTTDELRAVWEEANARFKAERTVEAMDAAKAAWKAYDESVPRRKMTRPACRAGKRQQAERRAIDSYRK